MTLPNFIVCGIQKGGTTSLYHYLREHPEVFMSETKEVNFFHLHFDRGPDWYASHFADVGKETAIGEASPNYMHHPGVARRIHDLLPDAKLLFVLRDPVDRAYSNFWFNIGRETWDPSASFSDVLRTEDGADRLIEKGYYHRHLGGFLEHFDRDRILVLLNEDLQSNPEEVMRDCYRFLDVSEDFVPETDRRYNATELPRGRIAILALKVAPRIRSVARVLVPTAVKTLLEMPRARLRRLFFEKRRPEPIADADRAYLEDLYRDDVLALAERFRLDLSAWRTYRSALDHHRDGAA